MKYIVIKVSGEHLTQELPFIFPNNLIHSEFAEQAKHYLMMQHNWMNLEVISAGEVSLFDRGGSGPFCHGFSESLGIGCRPNDEDSRLIQLADYGAGAY